MCCFGEGGQHSRTMKLEGVGALTRQTHTTPVCSSAGVLPVHPSPVGKYPHLVARVVSKAAKKAATTAPGASTRWQSEVTVNFHEVAVGTTIEKFIEIANVSPVSTDIFFTD